MIVFTRVCLILLVPLLVQAASPTSPHSGGSGNLGDSNGSSKEPPNTQCRRPAEDDHHRLRPLASKASDHSVIRGPLLRIVDEYYKAAIFPLGSTYGMPERSSIFLPIPADGYYRAPPKVAVGRPICIYPCQFLTLYQVVRLGTAEIPSQCIGTSPPHVADSEFPMLRIDLLIDGMQPSTEDDDFLQVWLLPPESKYHGRTDPTNKHPIESDKYIQLPPKVVVTTPIGTFTSASGHVVRTAPRIDIQKFRTFQERCQSGYDHATSQVHEEVSDIDRSVYVEACICMNARRHSRGKNNSFYLPSIKNFRKKRKSPPQKK